MLGLWLVNVYGKNKKVILCHIGIYLIEKKADEALKESSQLYYAMFEKTKLASD
jgi:hypothetical protein